MKYWVTSDHHFGHHNIIQFCGRPYRDVEHMNKDLLSRYNERVKSTDICFHLGDFCFKNSPGSTTGNGVPVKWTEYWDKMNGHKVLIQGNHDNNNSAKTIIQHMVIRYGHFRIGLIHDPNDIEYVEGDRVISAFNETVDFVLCGHVHNTWKYRWQKKLLIVNVGVDVWNYRPVSLEEILKYRNKVLKGEA